MLRYEWLVHSARPVPPATEEHRIMVAARIVAVPTRCRC